MSILPNVLACLEFSTLKITSLAILEVICRNYLDSQVLLSQLTVHGTISRLVNDLSFVLNSQKVQYLKVVRIEYYSDHVVIFMKNSRTVIH
jgi:hypothetical protein